MSAWKIIKKSFADFYKHLFLLGTISLIWFMSVGPLGYLGIGGLFLGQPFTVLLSLILIGPLTIGAYYFTNGLIKFAEFRIRDYFRGFAKFFLRGMLAYWLSLLIFIVLLVDLLFFWRFGNRILAYLSGLWVYLIVFYLMSQFYFWSLLVETEEGIGKCLKKSLLMTLDNILYSLVIFLAFVGLLAVGVVTAGVGLAVTFIGFLGILANNATYNLLVKYEVREELISPYNHLEAE